MTEETENIGDADKMIFQEIKKLGESVWEGCRGCNETDKRMWINGFATDYIMAKPD